MIAGADAFDEPMNLLPKLWWIAAGMVALPAVIASTPQSVYVHQGTGSYSVSLGRSPLPGSWVQREDAVREEVPPIFLNPGNQPFGLTPPQINATAFLNLGTFSVITTLPYDFQNTRYFTNRGTMQGAPGFRFDYTDDAGIRRPAANFINEAPGIIRTLDGVQYQGYSNVFFQTMLNIRATNVVSPGYLAAGNNGTVRIEGQDVNLSRGAVEVGMITGSPNANVYVELTDSDPRPDAFFPENAIYDYYWGAGIQEIPIPGPINTANILRFSGQDVTARAPTHRVLTLGPAGWVEGYASFGTSVPGNYFTAFGNTGIVAQADLVLTNADGSTTNLTLATNIFRQAIIVGIQDTNLTVRAKFGRAGVAGMGFGATGVEVAWLASNVVSASTGSRGLYFYDFLGGNTNTLVVTNLGALIPTGRPYCYEVWRDDAAYFSFFGANGNAQLTNDFLYSQSFSNTLATNYYAGYRFGVDNIQSRPAVIPGVSSVTNTPGRIEIVADTVDLTKTRLQGVNMVQVKAGHLKGSSGAAIDVENLIYDLTSTNGLLTVQNMAKETTQQVRGDVRMWTGIWSNTFEIVFTNNWFVDPAVPTNYVSPLTNQIDVFLYCWIISADLLTRTQQVVTRTLVLNSTNVVLEDPFLVSDRLEIKTERLTVDNRFTMTGDLRDWTEALTPGLRFLTNNGTITVPNVAYFGADFPEGRKLERFVNTGTLTAAAHEITAEVYEDSGRVTTANDLRLTAGTAVFNGAVHSVSGSANYFGRDYKLTGLDLTAGRSLVINVTNSFADSGPDAGNYLDVQDGFHLVRKPALGDLLGTRLVTTAPRFASVVHTWAAEDRGAKSAGFQDNVAIGHLTLASLRDGQLRFGPPTDGMGFPLPGKYGLYVDYLEFSTNRPGGAPSVADDPEGHVVIEPGLTIYFGMSNLDPEDLNGRFDGRLQWVKDRVGPESGVDVALRDGRTIRVNLGLLQSTQIDSDGDGVVNGSDIYPFDDLLITNFRLVSVDPYVAELQWRAAANTTYEVAYATNLLAPAWQVIATKANPEPSIQFLTVRDEVPSSGAPAGGSERYYRVSYEP